jgi:hypothetical protein
MRYLMNRFHSMMQEYVTTSQIWSNISRWIDASNRECHPIINTGNGRTATVTIKSSFKLTGIIQDYFGTTYHKSR